MQVLRETLGSGSGVRRAALWFLRLLSSCVGISGLGMLTRQNAEPLLGMKLTLFLSGHRNCGISRGGLALRRWKRRAIRWWEVLSQLWSRCKCYAIIISRLMLQHNSGEQSADKAADQDTLQHSLCFLCEDLDSLTALGWLTFEHVAVVWLRGWGVFG